MKRLIALLLPACALLGFGADAVGAPPNQVEAAIVQHIQRDHERSLALLKETVDINSGTMNLPGVRRVGAVFEREFKALGFTTQWIDGAGFHRAGHLVASRGKRGPRILLIGHLDTVFAEDSPFQSLQLSGPRAGSGPGSTDMKGGNVIMVHALRALSASGQLDRISVRVVLMGDEENRGDPLPLANRALLAAGDWATSRWVSKTAMAIRRPPPSPAAAPAPGDWRSPASPRTPRRSSSPTWATARSSRPRGSWTDSARRCRGCPISPSARA